MRRSSLGLFAALTFVVSWGIWIPMALASVSIRTPAGAILNVLATAGPSLAALVVTAVLGSGRLVELLGGFSPSRLTVRWSLVALALPLAMSTAAIALSAGLLGGRSPQVTLGTLGVLLAQFVRVLLLGGPLEEELGWRGFALPRLQARLPALDASILLGIVWGAWHIPLYFVPGTGQSETLAGGADPGFTIGGFVFWTTGLSVLFTWLFNQSSGSLLVAMLLHTSVDIGALLPSAVGSGGASSYLYVLITWIAAIAVTLRLGRKSLATAGRQVVSEPVEQRGRRDPGS